MKTLLILLLSFTCCYAATNITGSTAPKYKLKVKGNFKKTFEQKGYYVNGEKVTLVYDKKLDKFYIKKLNGDLRDVVIKNKFPKEIE